MGGPPFFIILGHGRSGTLYMAKLMGCFGFQIGHEKCGDHGISAMDALPDSPTNFGIVQDKYRLLFSGHEDTRLIHVVRNPWDVVESDLGRGGPVSAGVARWYKKDLRMNNVGITRVCYSVVLVNRRISQFKRDLVVRVEDASSVVGGWLKGRGLFSGFHGPLPAKNTGHKKHKKITQEEWTSANQNAVEELIAHAQEYGYPGRIP